MPPLCGVLDASASSPPWLVTLDAGSEAQLLPLSEVLGALRPGETRHVACATEGDGLLAVDLLNREPRSGRAWLWARSRDECVFFAPETPGEFDKYMRFRATQVLRAAGGGVTYFGSQRDGDGERTRSACEWLLCSDEAAPHRALDCGLTVRCGLASPVAALVELSRRAPAPSVEVARLLGELDALERECTGERVSKKMVP